MLFYVYFCAGFMLVMGLVCLGFQGTASGYVALVWIVSGGTIGQVAGVLARQQRQIRKLESQVRELSSQQERSPAGGTP